MEKYNGYVIILPYTIETIDIETFLFIEQKVFTYCANNTQDTDHYYSLKKKNLIEYINAIIDDFYFYYGPKHSLKSLYNQAFHNELCLYFCISEIVPTQSCSETFCQRMGCDQCWENTILLKEKI